MGCGAGMGAGVWFWIVAFVTSLVTYYICMYGVGRMGIHTYIGNMQRGDEVFRA